MLFNKVIGEDEKCVFYFYLKTKQTFWPTQYHANTNQKKDGVAILISEKVDFRKREIMTDKCSRVGNGDGWGRRSAGGGNAGNCN